MTAPGYPIGRRRAICISRSTESPGWAVEIPLEGTGLEGKPPEGVQMGGDESDCVNCSVEGGVFHGFGSPANLHQPLETFRR